MRQNIFFQKCLFFSLALILLVGCAQRNNSEGNPSVSGEATMQMATTIPTASASPTVRISPTATHTPRPTITPLPTLPTDVAWKTVTTEIRMQDQCALPCFLGITPGKSNYEDTFNHFSQFSEIGNIGLESNRISFSDWFSLHINFPTNVLVAQVFRASGGKVAYFTVSAHISIIRNETRVYGDTAYVDMWRDYFLPDILTKYGKPGKVFIDTTLHSGTKSRIFPFVIWVVYPDQGFLIRYDGDNMKIGDNIRICPLLSDFDIISWRSETSTYERFIEGDMAMATSLGPQPLEDVTDFDIQSFYDRFKDAQLDTCFDTPVSLWP